MSRLAVTSTSSPKVAAMTICRYLACHPDGEFRSFLLPMPI